MLLNLEYRLKAGSSQDRSGNLKNSARTTDKSNQNGWIYSLLSRNNKMKRELTTGNMVFVFGQQAYGLTTLNGQVEMIIGRGPDKSDPFNQFTTVTYKVYAAAACLNPSAGRILFGHEIIA